MSYKQFKIFRILTAFFVAILVSVSVSTKNPYLALATVIVGMLFMFMVKRKVKDTLVDERVRTIAGNAALSTYSISVPIIAAISLFLVFTNLSNESSFNYQLGMTLSYIVLFEIAVYSLAYNHFKKKYGSDDEQD